MSTNNNSNNNKKNDNNTRDRNPQIIHSSAMTPSIITTINNTNPTPTPIGKNGNSNNNNGNINNKNKRPIEPFYESYIEDSFVGHWEREDDDTEDLSERDDIQKEDDEPDLHPSTIEFDFDSFGPESFIYAPSTVVAPEAATTAALESEPTTTTTTPLSTQTTIEGVKNDELQEVSQETLKVSSIVESQDEPKSATSNEDKQDDLQVNMKNLNTFNQNVSDSKCTQQINSTPIKEADPLNYNLVETAQIDLRVIEPYKKVISHAGYCHHTDPSSPPPKPGEPAPAVIVFSACYLPDRSRRDYNYVMDHLFLYVLSSLHELIADDYVLVYLHNTQRPSTSLSKASTSNALINGSSSSQATNAISNANEDHQQSQNNLPTFTWIKRCYQMIDRKLRKNLKILYLVKPTFWLKTIVIMCKPFISSKFSKKLRFIENMDSLKRCLPVDKLVLPASAANI